MAKEAYSVCVCVCIQLAKRALPNRPDGVVVCVQYSSVDDVTCTYARHIYDIHRNHFLIFFLLFI